MATPLGMPVSGPPANISTDWVGSSHFLQESSSSSSSYSAGWKTEDDDEQLLFSSLDGPKPGGIRWSLDQVVFLVRSLSQFIQRLPDHPRA